MLIPFDEPQAESVEHLDALQQIGVHDSQHQVLRQDLHEEVHKHQVQILFIQGTDSCQRQICLGQVGLDHLLKCEAVVSISFVADRTISTSTWTDNIRIIVSNFSSKYKNILFLIKKKI